MTKTLKTSLAIDDWDYEDHMNWILISIYLANLAKLMLYLGSVHQIYFKKMSNIIVKK